MVFVFLIMPIAIFNIIVVVLVQVAFMMHSVTDEGTTMSDQAVRVLAGLQNKGVMKAFGPWAYQQTLQRVPTMRMITGVTIDSESFAKGNQLDPTRKTFMRYVRLPFQFFLFKEGFA